MGKLIRPTYPSGFSTGILILIFIISFVLSHQIFEVPFSGLKDDPNVYIGMFLVALTVVIVLLIIWEEILFPIKLKEVNGGMSFRNHRTKLNTQLLIYCSIPLIYGFIYMEYDVNEIRFAIWAAICILAPVLEKIASGIKNYNDFLDLTNEKIEYKNNEKVGSYEVKNIMNIIIVRDQRNVLEKIQLIFTNNDNVTIDLDEMELEAYYDFIYGYITAHYKHLVKETKTKAA